MSDAQNINLKPEDRMSQVGMILAEQAGLSLLSDTYKFPETNTGHMQVTTDGLMKIDGPLDTYARTSMMFKKDDKTTQFGTWNHTEFLDQNGNATAKVDQVNMGFLLDVLITNKMGSHSDFTGADGKPMLSLDGMTMMTPKDGSAGALGGTALPDPGKTYTNDSSYTIKDAAGNYLGDVHMMAKPKGAANVLDITAAFSVKGNYVGDIEEIITVDPNDHSRSSFQLLQEYNPPPPPPPAAPAKTA
jgi:hypothetical protein